MGAVRRVMLLLQEDTPLCSRPFVEDNSGEVIAWLEVGDREVAVWGTPVTLRRLAREAVVAAEEAEELAACTLNGAAS
jgi:hypothetical protein